MQDFKLTLFVLNLFCTLTITLAQQNNNNNHLLLLPTREECGRLQLQQLQNRNAPVEADEFPWMAQINYKDLRSSITTYRCLAVLISQRYLLTVAKCVERTRQHEPNKVLLGDFSSNADALASRLVGIEEIVVHPHFNLQTHANDIALLRLSETIIYTNYLRPICLPNVAGVKDKEYAAEQQMISGWFRRHLLSNIHKLPVVINNNVDCRRKLSNFSVSDGQMCGIACSQGSDFMPASAVMDIVHSEMQPSNYYLAGLVSMVNKQCSYPEEPDLFTRIDFYMNWIIDNIYE